jgi:hypothetical protein
MNCHTICIFFCLLLCEYPVSAQSVKLDERPAEEGTWGYRPDGIVSQTDPPSFSWRPQKGLTWEIECASDERFTKIVYQATGIEFNVHCPPQTLGSGSYAWRYRGKDKAGHYTDWSQARKFTIAEGAVPMPLPSREELIARIPRTHPRLLVRPEHMERLRELARGELKDKYLDLVKACEKILADPPPTQDPPKYPPGTVYKSEEWRKIWWGNRTYTINALNSAATLAFTRLLGGQERYGQEAKRILLQCAQWDPKGSTNYRYNDEAGMPYIYYFARAYTFANDLLSEEEKKVCRQMIKIRGDEMYHYLCPRHFWNPYASHDNRAWHKLGEAGVAFLGEVEGAEDWVWFAMNNFFNVYPVWSDDDGGWHEGSAYWDGYLSRFSEWADVMREATGVNAYQKPFFSKAGYYAMYLMPPGKYDGGFGDLAAGRTAKANVPLMTVLASQGQNPYWQWYVEQLGGPTPHEGYLGFIRGQLPTVQAKAPDDLPTSRLFQGTGQAYLNGNLTDATKCVQVVFKSSPLGTQSHGYESNNSFLLGAYGKRLLIYSGYRDIYGSEHHTKWMWSTRSTNCITVNGKDQKRHTVAAEGRITAFLTTPEIDAVIGDASQAYEPPVEQFKRAILFVKPDLVIVYDRLRASKPSTYEYWLHAVNKFDILDEGKVHLQNDDVACEISFLTPRKLTFSQTNEYDPNPRPRIQLREWHLTAKTVARESHMEFVTIYQPHRVKDRDERKCELRSIEGGYVLDIASAAGKITALLPVKDNATLTSGEMSVKGAIQVKLEPLGQSARTVEVRE